MIAVRKEVTRSLQSRPTFNLFRWWAAQTEGTGRLHSPTTTATTDWRGTQDITTRATTSCKHFLEKLTLTSTLSLPDVAVNCRVQWAPQGMCSPFASSLTVSLQVGAYVHHGTVIKKQVIIKVFLQIFCSHNSKKQLKYGKNHLRI